MDLTGISTGLPSEAGVRMRAEERRFRPYSEYRFSGIPWLGEVPKHWQVRRLKLVARIIMGQSPSSDEYNLTGDGPAFLQGNADFGHENPVPRVFCSAATKLAPTGSLLVSVRAPVGALNIADQVYGIGRGLSAVVSNDRLLDARYAWHSLSVYREELLSIATGSTYEAVTADEVGNLTILIPHLPEQRAIAGFLDRETGRIDELIAKKERLIELLAEKRTALISHAVTKGLNPAAPMKPSGIDWLGEVPAHWKIKRLKFLAQVGNGSTPSRENHEYWGGGFPWLNSSVVNLSEVTEASDLVTDLALAECHLPRVKPPAVLVGITGEGKTRGMATVLRIEATINQHLAFIRPMTATCSVEYVRYVMQAAYQFLRDESGGGGSTKGAITCVQLGNVAIPYPSPDEQRAIVAHLGAASASVEALVTATKTAIARLIEYRSALISAAVTGKIDVREESAG